MDGCEASYERRGVFAQLNKSYLKKKKTLGSVTSLLKEKGLRKSVKNGPVKLA